MFLNTKIFKNIQINLSNQNNAFIEPNKAKADKFRVKSSVGFGVLKVKIFILKIEKMGGG